MEEVSLQLYRFAADYSRERGIIIADTKFEFGYRVDTGELVIVDEALTPDSSRFWPADDYEVGRDQSSFDKQFVRNHLQALVDAGAWNKEPPGPVLPDDVVNRTAKKYRQAFEVLTRSALDAYTT